MGQEINAVSNNGFKNPIGAVSFGTFSPSVAYSLSGTTLTVTDNSTYDGDHAFTRIDIVVTDTKGTKLNKKITVASDDVAIDVSPLLANGGYNLMVTVIATDYLAVGSQMAIGAGGAAAANIINFTKKKETGVQPISMS